MKKFFIFVCIILFTTIIVRPAFAAKGGKKGGGGGGAVCKINTDTDVAVYIDGGIGPSSQLWAEALIEFWKTGRRQLCRDLRGWLLCCERLLLEG